MSLHNLEITDAHAHPFTPDYRASRELVGALTGMLSVLARYNAGLRFPNVLEFGPGLTTRLLCQYAFLPESDCLPSIVCVDEPGEWHQRTRDAIKDCHFTPHFITAATPNPQEFYGIYAGSIEWQELEDLAPFELVLIDGPGSSVARSTPHAFKLITEFASPNAIFVVDDSNREPEAQLVKNLLETRPHYRTALVRDGQFKYRTSTILFPV